MTPGFLLLTIKPGVTTGDELSNLVRREAMAAGIPITVLSKAVLGTPSRVIELRNTVGPVRKSTLTHVVSWLERSDQVHERERLDALREAVSAMEPPRESVRPKPAAVANSLPPPVSSSLSASALVAEVDAFLEKSGMGEFEFATRALDWRSLSALRQGFTVTKKTADKIRGFIAKDPQPCRQRRITPSAVASARMRDGAEEKSENITRRRDLTERAHESRAPGETLADRVRRLAEELEAEENDAAEADAERESERRLDEIVEPSALIRRAQRDWPDQAAKVRRVAASEGISLGEAWRRVIAAGIDQLSRGGL
jgi:hypothetical protein